MSVLITDLFTQEPPYFLKEHYHTLLDAIAQHNISDLTVQTNTPIFGLQYGQHRRITTRKLSVNEVEDFINLLYGDNATARILGGSDLDFSYTHRLGATQMVRFRINASLISLNETLGIQISMRSLATTPPPIEQLLVPENIKNLSFIKEGIILVCGATGSGKSTLLASMLALRAEQSQTGEKIITFEAPIEYVLPSHIGRSLIAQSELPRCFPNFAYAVRNALRRAPTSIMVGEARDHETISAVIEAALTGHSVFSTLHSQSVVHAINRVLMLFPEQEKVRICHDFFSTVEAIIWQKLIPSCDGKRVALREYIVIDPELRAKLLISSISEVSNVLKSALEENKTSLNNHANELLQKKIIDRSTYVFYTQHDNKSEEIR